MLSKLAATIGLSKVCKEPISTAAESVLDLCVGPSVTFKVDISCLGNAGDSRLAWLATDVWYRAIRAIRGLGESSSSDFSGGSVSRSTVDFSLYIV